MINENPSLKNFEILSGIVERVTFHSPESGWTVLRVSPFKGHDELVTVIVHQAQVFAGATMEFHGAWVRHQKHGDQFKAIKALEKKPASTAALEKYLGSGLIKGVGPITAKKIVSHFKEKTLSIFESQISDLLEVPGIAEKKLELIANSWKEHKSIRDVMLFLQNYGISTLFSVKIFKTYGEKSIQIVSENPYRLAQDIYGIGFFSADRIALSMGMNPLGPPRIQSGIKHILANSREQGHCFLSFSQIHNETKLLLAKGLERDPEAPPPLPNAEEPLSLEVSEEIIQENLQLLIVSQEIKKRNISLQDETPPVPCYYSKTLYFDEIEVVKNIKRLMEKNIYLDKNRLEIWIQKYCELNQIKLSDEQFQSVCQISSQSFSILTGGPGCGKTTTTRVLVHLLRAMQRRVLLTAPTGRASQRMSEVIGLEAKTIHRLLEWSPTKFGFKKDATDPLDVDFLIVDETSMLDISLSAALLKAIPSSAQVLFIGDPDQLPAVGAGNVLNDLISSEKIPTFRLNKIFRQAEASSIIQFAHQINKGQIPKILSPVSQPQLFKEKMDCLFLDTDEATNEQLQFIRNAKKLIQTTLETGEEVLLTSKDQNLGRLVKISNESIKVEEEIPESYFKPSEEELAEINKNNSFKIQKKEAFSVPEKFLNVSFEKLSQTKTLAEELKTVLKKIHPWSTLHYGMTATESLLHLYTKTLPQHFGKMEIQVLSPQIRGSLGTYNLNLKIQEAINPFNELKPQIRYGEKIFRLGDRIIQTRNNYDLNVFNGDIGNIIGIDTEDQIIEVRFNSENKVVLYKNEDWGEIQLAYAITIHKSQGSEFPIVIIPVSLQHFNMLFRNLIYTGLTRAKKMALFVGGRKALAYAVRQMNPSQRQTYLKELL